MHSYQPFEFSNQTGQAFLLPVVGIASAALAAFAYAWIDVYSPIAGYVSFLFVLGLGFGAALPVAIAGHRLKVRNPLILRINGAVTGVLAVYLAWVFFAWVLLRRDAPPDEVPALWTMIHSPGALWDFTQFLAENGWYSIRTFTPTGIVLWAFWAIEAAVVIGLGVLLSTSRVIGQGFCEDCNQWLQPEETVAIPADQGAPGKLIHSKGLAGITSVAPPSARASRWLNISRQRCGGCGQTATFQVDDVKAVQEKNGVKLVATPVVPLSMQGDAERTEIERIAALLAEADRQRFADVASKSDEATTSA